MSERDNKVDKLLLLFLIIGTMIRLVIALLDTDSKLRDLQRRIGQLESQQR